MTQHFCRKYSAIQTGKSWRLQEHSMRFLALFGLVIAACQLGTSVFGQEAAKKAPQPEVDWRNVRELTIEGQGWKDTKAPFDRLPAKAEGKVRPAVWGLSHDSVGICVRFASDSPAIHCRW